SLVKGMVSDATSKPAEAPAVASATQSAALEFTTPDGGVGIARGYQAYGWVVVIVAGGRLATTTARPVQPAGARFLASLRFHPIAGPASMIELPRGSKLDIPSTAWPVVNQAQPSDRVFLLVSERAFLNIREFDRLDDCER